MADATRRGFLSTMTAMGGAAVATAVTQGADARADTLSRSCPPTPGLVSVGPDDPRYQDLILRGYNARFLGSPETVHVVHSADQVVRAVNQAVRAGKRIVVRGGGHCFENFVDDPSAQVVIDLSQLNGVAYDPRHHAFAVEAGATLGQVYRSLSLGWGVTLPAGTCPSVGVGGHVAGGGYGLLSRRHGLVVDHLHGVEAVVVDRSGRARVVVATRERDDPHHDLWWAHTGGGGGNFGIVTRYLMRSPHATRRTDPANLLPAPPAGILACQMSWDWAELTRSTFARLLDNYGRWQQGPMNEPAYAGMDTTLALPHRAGGRIGLTALLDVPGPAAEESMGRFIHAMGQGVGEPLIEVFGTSPYLRLVTSSGDAAGSFYLRSKSKCGYLRAPWTPKQVETVYRYLTEGEEDPGGAVYLNSFGGTVNKVPADATAFPHRSSSMIAFYDVGWYDPAQDEEKLAWVRRLYREVYEDTGGVPALDGRNDGAYINYPDLDLADPAHNTSGTAWHTLYYKDNYARLQRVKARFDPLDLFHHGLSVRPPGGDAAVRKAAAPAGRGRLPRPEPRSYAKPAAPVHGVAHRILDAGS
ncbi:FAD-binding oxidoreductase [Nonomuraea sp. NPDC047897]|uniref:FAD-binding oxidoreductase n=1 Tax=Nonomuraea sp. NPDC047897 TaxID=3364346 RepID=UPI003712AB71